MISTSCRSPHLWRDPDSFRPERFSEANANADFGGAWAGYRPEAQGSSLYPNEVASDFAFIPFGGGMRKCVGDQFALTEAAVALVLLLRCAAQVSRTRLAKQQGVAFSLCKGQSMQEAGLPCLLHWRAN